MRPYADLGVAEVHVMHLGNEPVGFLHRMSEVVPALHAL